MSRPFQASSSKRTSPELIKIWKITVQQIEFSSWEWQYDNSTIAPQLLMQLSQGSVEQIRGIKVLQQRRGRKALALGAGDSGQSYFIKYFYPRSWREYVKYFFSKSRAEKEWQAAGQLRALGFDQPELLAIGERRSYGIWSGSYLIIRYVTQAQTLIEICKQRRFLPRQVISLLAAQIAKLHKYNLYYSDLHGGNILLQAQAAGQYRVLLIDACELLQLENLDYKKRIEDLARLNAFVAAHWLDRYRFLLYYSEACGFDSGQIRKLRIAVDKRTSQLWRHYLKKHGIDYKKINESEHPKTETAS